MELESGAERALAIVFTRKGGEPRPPESTRCLPGWRTLDQRIAVLAGHPDICQQDIEVLSLQLKAIRR